MAKRRRLEAPKPEDLEGMEEGFARETSRGMFGGAAPIAQVAGEAAALSEMSAAEDRASRARDARDAERMRVASEAGLLIEELDVTSISVDGMVRDRVALDREAMAEIKASLATHGLRMPIEVMQQEGGYALISGFRRLLAVRELLGETGEKRFGTIRAIVRAPLAAADAFVAMVEENEIRADLSHYERGRIAVMAAGQGAFTDTDAAIAALFASASKAKRSKIRSFALVHETLGDVLSFPSALSERSGLRVAQTLRAGFVEELRAALEIPIDTAEAELSAMEAVIKRAEAKAADPTRGGRPKRARTPGQGGRFDLANGRYMVMDTDDQGHFVRFHGPNVNAELVSTVLHEIHRMLGPAD